MGAALERDQELRSEAAWRKHFSAGTACQAGACPGCRTTRPDAERDRCGTVEAKDSYQQECGLAVLPAARHHLQKKRVCGRPNNSAQTSPERAGAGYESRACLIRPGWCSSTRRQSPPTWCGLGAAVRVASN